MYYCQPAVGGVDPVRGEAVDDDGEGGEHAEGTHVAPVNFKF